MNTFSPRTIGIFTFLFCFQANATITIKTLLQDKSPTLCSVVDQIKNQGLKKPTLVIWYIGPNGFRVEGAQYYQTYLFNPLESLSEVSYRCQLYDLTSWAVLGQFGKSFETVSKLALEFERTKTERQSKFEILFSREFFRFLGRLTPPQLQLIKSTILNREFIWQKSKNRKATGKTLNQALSEEEFKSFLEIEIQQDPSFQSEIGNLGSLDVAQAYSLLQYLEGLFLIRKLITDSKNEETEILFLLPNDELAYYLDEKQSFESLMQDYKSFFDKVEYSSPSEAEAVLDQAEWVEDRGEFSHKQKIPCVYFQGFRYGEQESDRPYTGKSAKKTKGKLLPLTSFLPELIAKSSE